MNTGGDRRRQVGLAEIRLHGLRAMGIHGALPEEQTRPQPFELDVCVAYDAAVAVESDALDDAIDYGALAERAVTVVARERFTLLERLAARVCEVLLADARIQSVDVTISKPRAPLSVDAEGVSVRLVRTDASPAAGDARGA